MTEVKLEPGCYGDGTYGHQHTRESCAETIGHVAHETEGTAKVPGIIVDALRGEMSDDAWEEHAACEWLERWAPHSWATWGWQAGDFGLWLHEGDDDD